MVSQEINVEFLSVETKVSNRHTYEIPNIICKVTLNYMPNAFILSLFVYGMCIIGEFLC